MFNDILEKKKVTEVTASEGSGKKWKKISEVTFSTKNGKIKDKYCKSFIPSNELAQDMLMKKHIDYEYHLMNLLCIIHRDGGHYITKHGVMNAIEDAKKIVSDAIVR